MKDCAGVELNAGREDMAKNGVVGTPKNKSRPREVRKIPNKHDEIVRTSAIGVNGVHTPTKSLTMEAMNRFGRRNNTMAFEKRQGFTKLGGNHQPSQVKKNSIVLEERGR